MMRRSLMSRRRFMRNAAGLLVPLALSPRLAFPGIIIQSGGRSANVGGGGGGELVHGGSIVADITGLGAESRASPSPVLYDDFSLGTSGQPIVPESGPLNDAVIGTWMSDDRTGNTGTIDYSNALSLNGGMSALAPYRFPSPYTCDLRPLFKSGGNSPALASGDAVYVEFCFNWARIAGDTAWCRNWKLFRFTNNTPDDYNLSTCTAELVFMPEGWDGLNNYSCDGSGADRLNTIPGDSRPLYERMVDWDSMQIVPTSGFPTPKENRWHTLQIWYKYATSGGFYSEWDNDILGGEKSGANTAAFSPGITSFNLPHYYATDDTSEPPNDQQCSCDLYVDYVYVDRDWRLAIIGNASTWAASTRRSAQVQLARSTTQVTIDPFNKGKLQTGDSAYLYLSNSDGSIVNAGAGRLLGVVV